MSTRWNRSPLAGKGRGESPASSAPTDRPGTGGSRWRTSVAVVAGVVGVIAGAFWLRCVVVVLSSRFSTNPASDPHGYGLIFGTVLAVPAAAVVAVTLPFAFPRQHRARLVKIAAPTLILTTALLFVALFTA